MDYEKDIQLMHPIIQRHKELLKRMSDQRVMALMFEEPDEFFLL